MPDFEEIYQTYFADVYRYILALSRDAHTAEEVTQETFFRALASIDQFRGDCQLRVAVPDRPEPVPLAVPGAKAPGRAGAGAGGRRAGVRLCGPGRRQAAPPAAP